MKAKRQYGFEPDYAVLPGDTVREVMEYLGMTQRELSARTDLTVQTISRIFKGDQPISYETANSLELATGAPARLWNNLEAGYGEQKAKLKEPFIIEVIGFCTHRDKVAGDPLVATLKRRYKTLTKRINNDTMELEKITRDLATLEKEKEKV
jgi:plasmid maintenance system antidote protein VapI